jgi:diguanylate cyclase (GGDEF)-like protein
MIHKLGGSAATFGYDLLSQRSKDFEYYIDSFLSREKIPGDDELETMRTYFAYVREAAGKEAGGTSGSEESGEHIGELEELSGQDSQREYETEETAPTGTAASSSEGVEAGNSPAGDTPEEPQGIRQKKIYLYGFPQELSKEITDQVGFYGYDADEVKDIEELCGSVEEGEYRLLCIYIHALMDHPEGERKLSRVKSECPSRIDIIFVSEEDTFDLRLRAIRTGGEAFMVLPLEIGWVIDKLDSFTHHRQPEPYHVLIIDDDQEQVAYYAMLLQQAGMITSVASDPLKVLSILVESKPDMILMDLYMPNCNGIELVKLLRQHEVFITIPIIFLSYENDSGIQMEAIRGGGDDFFTKPIDPQYLISIVQVRAARNRSLRFFMERDSLTGLLNHSNLKEQLNRELVRADRMEIPVCFAMIDTDHFKKVNDTFGHLTGDRVLKSLSRLLQERVRRTDIVGRYGGEEFGVILLNASLENAKMIMNEIRENFSRVVHRAEDREFFVTFSCGIASYPEYEDVEALCDAADEAMYKAKEAGRNRVALAGGSVSAGS